SNAVGHAFHLPADDSHAGNICPHREGDGHRHRWKYEKALTRLSDVCDGFVYLRGRGLQSRSRLGGDGSRHAITSRWSVVALHPSFRRSISVVTNVCLLHHLRKVSEVDDTRGLRLCRYRFRGSCSL